ncbi:hypothetical protein FISHEDRAFT_24124, partial [Fistulina hepatica ATCC 64428]
RFCIAFMTELSRHIGQDTDVPGTSYSRREIGFLFGAYRKMRNEFISVLTGKGADWGGSYIRPEATSYGLIYYIKHMIARTCPQRHFGVTSTRVAISGARNIAQFTALKVIELSATVVSLSDSHRSPICKEGFTKDVVKAIGTLKLQG